MATLLTKKSDTASSVPLAADLTNAAGGAELAVNTADKRLYSKTSGGTVVELGTNPSSMTLPNGTANGVPYLNASKVLTSGSALTFDGTNLQNINKVISGGTGGSNGYFQLNRTDAANLGSIQWVTSGDEMRYSNNNGGFHSWFIGSEQMRLTSTGLGIGTSSPGAKLELVGGSGKVFAANTTVSTPTNVSIQIGGFATTSNSGSFIKSYVNLGSNLFSSLAFEVNGGALEAARFDSSGNFIHQVNGAAPTLATNSTMSFELTSNTSLKIVVRGTDGVTRSVSLTLA